MLVDLAFLELPAHASALRERLVDLLPVELKSCLDGLEDPAEDDRRTIHAHLTRLLAALNAVMPRWLLNAADCRNATCAYGQEATLLFADVTGFTSLTARMAAQGRVGAEYITDTLNHLFTTIVPIAFAYGGDLLAFGGDAILVAFSDPGHTMAAATAAWEMQRALEWLHLDPIAGVTQLLRLQMKIGVASGPLMLASVGTETRRVPLALGSVLDTTDAMANATSPGGIRLDMRAAADAPLANLARQPDGSALLVGLPGTLSPSTHSRAPDLPSASIVDLTARIVALAPYLPSDLFAALAGTPHSTPGDGEQRHVLSLFSHLAGLHRLADMLGPERAGLAAEVAELAIVRALRVIESHGGVLARVDTYAGGHKLLALFGAPIAHEQEVQRAAQAALALRDELRQINAEVIARLAAAVGRQMDTLKLSQPLLGLRTGIHAGPVMAGLVGSPRRWEYTVTGDSVNVAMRLMSNASLEHSEVLVGPGIFSRLRDQIEGESRIVIPKGKLEPMEVWSVRALRSAARAHLEQTAPLVGREQERQAMQAAVDALRGGAARLVFIRGEAGIGKTRLLRELPPLLGPDIVCLETGSPGLVPVSFGLFRALLLTLSGQSPDTPPSVAVEQLRGMIERLYPNQSDELWPALKTLLGLDDPDSAALGASPEAQQRMLAAAMLRVLAGVAAERPLAWLCEDLHEVDGASLALLEQMLTIGWRMPLLFCATLRSLATATPHPAHRLVEIGSQRFDGAITTLEIGGLSAGDGATLLDTLLPGLAPEACAALLAHTRGNPLFLEVLAQTVQQRKLLRPTSQGLGLRAALGTLGVPRTLHELVTAQVDRLPPEVRRVARAAAVIAAVDHSFPPWLLEQIVDERHAVEPRLHALERARIVEELPGEPARRYTFRHALYQQAAYDQLLERERRELHRRAGLALHELATESQETSVEALAYHCYEGRCWELAARYSLAAGHRAQQTYANREARRYLRRALGLARRLGWPQQEAEARERLGELYSLLGRYPAARAQLERALRQGATEADPAQSEAQARRHRLLGKIAEFVGEYDRAEAECRAGLRLAQNQLPATRELPRLYEQLAVVLMRRGMLDDADKVCREGLETLPSEPVALGERVDLLQLLGALDAQRSNYHSAIQTLGQCLSLARALGNLAVTPPILRNLGLCFHFVGQREQALACYQESLSINERTGDIIGQLRVTDNLGLLCLIGGDYDQALHHFLECSRIAEALNVTQIHANVTINIGHLFYIQEQYTQALLHMNRAQVLFSKLGDARGLAECFYRLGDVAIARDEADRALQYGEQALYHAQTAGCDSYETNALRVIGEALLAQERIHEAVAALDRARQIIRHLDDPWEHVLFLRAQALLTIAQGRCREATHLVQAGLELAQTHQMPYLIALMEKMQQQIVLK